MSSCLRSTAIENFEYTKGDGIPILFTLKQIPFGETASTSVDLTDGSVVMRIDNIEIVGSITNAVEGKVSFDIDSPNREIGDNKYNLFITTPTINGWTHTAGNIRVK